jgi:hypothetical protein
LRSIFNFWIEKKLLTENRSSPSEPSRPRSAMSRAPYTDEQVTTIFGVIGNAVPKNLAPDARPLLEQRVRTFLNLLLHTGSDQGDAILFEQDRITEGGRVNGKTVYVYRYEPIKTRIPRSLRRSPSGWWGTYVLSPDEEGAPRATIPVQA